MSNPLYSLLGNGNVLPGNMGQMVSQFRQFQQMFKGDARAQVQQLLNSGKVTQEQYNRAVQMAQQLQSMLNR